MTLTKSQQAMADDGAPMICFASAEERRLSWEQLTGAKPEGGRRPPMTMRRREPMAMRRQGQRPPMQRRQLPRAPFDEA